MIEFKVTGETWKEIQEKLKGLFPETKQEKISETVESPPDSFTPDIPDEPIDIPEITEEEPTSVPDLPSPPGLPVLTLDSTGIPWNSEIHTRTKSINEDGTWRMKRQSPGFEKKKSILPPGTGIASRSQLTTVVPAPEVTTAPPSKKFDTLDELMHYINKINDSGKTDYENIRVYLTTLGITNVVQLPVEKLTETAASLKLKFGVEYP